MRRPAAGSWTTASATVSDEAGEFDEEANTVVGHSKPNNIAPASNSAPIPRPAGRRRKPVTLPPPHGADSLAISGHGSNLPLPDNGTGEQNPLGFTRLDRWRPATDHAAIRRHLRAR